MVMISTDMARAGLDAGATKRADTAPFRPNEEAFTLGRTDKRR